MGERRRYDDTATHRYFATSKATNPPKFVLIADVDGFKRGRLVSMVEKIFFRA